MPLLTAVSRNNAADVALKTPFEQGVSQNLSLFGEVEESHEEDPTKPEAFLDYEHFSYAGLIDVRRNAPYAILDLGCTRAMGSRIAIDAF